MDAQATDDNVRTFQGWGFTVTLPEGISMTRINGHDPSADAYSLFEKNVDKPILRLCAGFHQELLYKHKAKRKNLTFGGIEIRQTDWQEPSGLCGERLIFLHSDKDASKYRLAMTVSIIFKGLDSREKQLAEQIISSVTPSYETTLDRFFWSEPLESGVVVPKRCLSGWGFSLAYPDNIAVNELSVGRMDFDLYELIKTDSGKKLLGLYVGSHPSEVKMIMKGKSKSGKLNGAKAKRVEQQTSGLFSGHVLVEIHGKKEAKLGGYPRMAHIFYDNLTDEELRLANTIIDTLRSTLDRHPRP